ncbi:hypothetical protein BH23ACT12_BH23ACT12_03200 [soil metagenome]
MPAEQPAVEAVIAGAGFYGTTIALYLAARRGFRDILLVEREEELLSRASYNNQARVHNGYHYPRSFTTAYRSRVNLPRFLRDWPEATVSDFTKVYAIARNNSKVTAGQFKRFCAQIGAKIESAEPWLRSLFEPRLIEDVFVVQEYAFDATKLARLAKEELLRAGVQVRTGTQVTEVFQGGADNLIIGIVDADRSEEQIACRYLFNCTYSGLNQLGGDFPGTTTQLKHEITEMALLKVPDVLSKIGVTVMDGFFFSLMPFPSRQLHTLSHVRYTPHLSWSDKSGSDPYKQLEEYDRTSRVDRMIRDACRYLPDLINAGYVESLFEVKTVLTKNESDDGRPILFERHPELPGCYSVLGGKIDNVYDVIEKLDAEPLTRCGRSQ